MLNFNKVTTLLPVFSLLAIGVLAYGVFIPWLGFYHDDWPVIWAYKSSGIDGLTAYFHGNRPVYGMFLSTFFSLLDAAPLPWHVLVLLVRCTSSIGLYFLFRALFPQQSSEAWLIAVLALLYPGFTLQPLAVTYLPHQVSFLCLVFSLLCTIAALQVEGGRWVWTILGLASSLAGYLIIEYYAGLEFLRPVVLWLALRNQPLEAKASHWTLILRGWLPYLGVFFLFIWYRVFFVQTWPPSHDGMSQLGQILNNPLSELGGRAIVGIQNILMATPFAWFRTLESDILDYGFGMSVPFSWAIGLLTAGTALVTLEVLKHYDHRRVETGELTSAKTDLIASLFLLIGIWALLIGGLPILYSGLSVLYKNNYFGDRYTLPYLLGSCLILVGLLQILRLSRFMRVMTLFLIIFFFSSFQVRNGNSFRKDWQDQKSLFWQLVWRVPYLKQGSSLFLADLPFSLPSNHSAGMLDLLYEADELNLQLDYFIFDINRGLKTDFQNYYPGLNYVANLRPDSSVMGGVRSFIFHGNTSQSLVAWNSPSGTLRILKGQDTGEAFDFPSICRTMHHLSSAIKVIDPTTPKTYGSLLKILSPEPEHGWTYFYQKAELNCQEGKWHEVVRLAEQVNQRGFHPLTVNEWYPFIEGYAMVGRFDLAFALTDQIISDHPEEMAGLSSLWRKIYDRKATEPEDAKIILRALQAKLFIEQ